MRMRRWAVSAIGLASLGVLAAQEEAVFRGGVQLVDLLVTVRDKKGAVVKDLQQSDFRILEDGKEQEIRRFARETDLPLTLGLLVDVSGSVIEEFAEEKRAAQMFIEQVIRPQDHAFIIGFARTAVLLQDTTDSVPKLQDGLDDLVYAARAEAPTRPMAMGQFPGGSRFPIPIPGGTGGGGRGGGPTRRPNPTIQVGGTVLYDALFLSADELLRPASGRKAIVVITDGEDHGSKVTLAESIEAALKSDTIVYSIFIKPDRRGAGDEAILERLSGETGGRVYRFSRRNLSKIFDEISEELRSQYSISYAPSKPATSGEYRRLEVRLSKKDLKAQTRAGYYARSR